MIKRQGDFSVEVREKMRGGEGSVKVVRMWEPEKEMLSKNRLFAKLLIEPGCGIGFHKHDNEDEIFVIIKGRAEADDNGSKSVLEPGDTILTGNGAGHSIKCVGDEPLEVLAVISGY